MLTAGAVRMKQSHTKSFASSPHRCLCVIWVCVQHGDDSCSLNHVEQNPAPSAPQNATECRYAPAQTEPWTEQRQHPGRAQHRAPAPGTVPREPGEKARAFGALHSNYVIPDEQRREAVCHRRQNVCQLLEAHIAHQAEQLRGKNATRQKNADQESWARTPQACAAGREQQSCKKLLNS